MNDVSNTTIDSVFATVTENTLTKGDKKAAAMAKMSQSKPNGKAPANVARRMPIGDGETASRNNEVLDDHRVKASYTFKLSDADKQRYGIVTLLDYTNCTQAEILELATRSIVITLQRNLRQMGDGALDANVYQVVDVKRDLVDAQRSVADTDTRDLHAFARVAKLPVDVARRILAQLADGSLKLK